MPRSSPLRSSRLLTMILGQGSRRFATSRLSPWPKRLNDFGRMIAPGGSIGIVGGGQLGRMLAIAAAQLGYKCHIFDPRERPCAADVAAKFTRAAYDDVEALRAFAASVDVVTYEFENLPAEPLRAVGDK